jgi:putative ABC transport system permease protein
MQPGLVPAAGEQAADGEERFGLLDADALYLSPAASRWLEAGVGDHVVFRSGLREVRLRVGGLAPGAGSQRLAVMDIGAAQWRFDRLGVLNRIDLRLRPGTDGGEARRAIQALLPPGVLALEPDEARQRQTNLSRAYRVNLNMLALIALFTGAFLVFSAQSLSVLRRRGELAFLRAAGLTRRALVGWLVLEAASIGTLGAVAGAALGIGLAGLALAALGGDLGAGYFSADVPQLAIDPWATAGFVVLGIAAAAAGALAPALEAAATPPALALKAGDEARPLSRLDPFFAGLAVLILGAALAWLPPVAGLPVFGYLSVAALLVGAILLMPRLARTLLGMLPERGGAAWQLARAQLKSAPGQAVVASAGVLASVGLAVAMAVMVASFRDSLEVWLDQVLPADLYARASRAGETGFLTVEDQAAISGIRGTARMEFQRQQNLLLDSDRPPVALIARPLEGRPVERVLPLVAGGAAAGDALPVWVSEAMRDLYGWAPGRTVMLPLAGRQVEAAVAGIWRDYARQHGAIAMDLGRYRALTGDMLANDVAIWLAPGHGLTEVGMALRTLPGGDGLEVAEPGEIRAVSLRLFDRTFLVTYALEAVAVLIGISGVAASFGGLALARRREFGMLRHLGMTRRQIAGMLAREGGMVAALGVAAGTALGLAIGVVLIRVVNRQSFHWSMDITVPFGALALFALMLVALAAAASVLAARAAMGMDALRAVREDW